MATFTLSGSGTHAITAGTGALHVHVTTLPTIRGAGRAEPTNYYDLGLLRLGDGTYWWPSIPIDAEFQLLGCPQGTLEIAYALFNGTELSVVEVAGANPLAGSRALEDLSDVLIASVANGDVLQWNASASKWENAIPTGGGGTLTSASNVLAALVACPIANTYYDGPDVVLAAGTWFVTATLTAFNNTGGGSLVTIKLWDGVNIFASTESFAAAGSQDYPLTVSAVVVLGASTTVKVSMAWNNNNGRIAANCANNGAPAKASQINALKIA